MGGSFCSNPCRTAFIGQHPERFPASSRRSSIGKREDLGGLFVRSSWEANYARYLNFLIHQRQIKSWEYEVDTFEFKGIKRGSRFYTPDFKVFNLDGSFEYHEVKGYMDSRSQTKLKRMAKYHPQVKIILIQRREYQEILEKLGRVIPNWEWSAKAA